MIAYIGTPTTTLPKNLLLSIRKFSKDTGYKFNIQKSIALIRSKKNH